MPIAPLPPVDELEVRRIVREELAIDDAVKGAATASASLQAAAAAALAHFHGSDPVDADPETVVECLRVVTSVLSTDGLSLVRVEQVDGQTAITIVSSGTGAFEAGPVVASIVLDDKTASEVADLLRGDR